MLLQTLVPIQLDFDHLDQMINISHKIIHFLNQSLYFHQQYS